ncbi:MAG: TPM domain-containing protein [Aridibacter sp.]
MRKSFIKKLSLIFVLCFLTQISFSQNNESFSIDKSPLPAPTSPVMDYAGVLDSATKQRLEDKIEEFEKTSNPKVELGVVVVDTTGDRPIFDYSLAVARGWGIGSRDADNPGALLFIAVKDKKYFTQVSRDLEDELPDGVVGSLQRKYLVPQFKRGDYSKGIEDTIDAYIRTIKAKQSGETPVNQNDDRNYNDSNKGNGFFCCLIIIGIIIFIIISNSGGGGGRRRRRNSGSGVAGDILSGILTGIVLGGGSGGGSSGGSSWGGGSSGGGGGWGGFGGGGDFGGGGAGGGW